MEDFGRDRPFGIAHLRETHSPDPKTPVLFLDLWQDCDMNCDVLLASD
jgi:hypothetical protein